ncbi:MAG: Clp protease N-terminal domain-containing protein [Terriglobales bacterium]
MFERYTEKARRVIFFARYEASRLGSTSINPEHLLLGLLRESQSLFANLPAGAVDKIRARIDAHVPRKSSVSTSIDLPLTADSHNILKFAAEEADGLAHRHIGADHLVLGILLENQCFTSDLLREFGIEAGSFREKIKNAVLDVDIMRRPGPRQGPRYSTGPLVSSRETKITIHDHECSARLIQKTVKHCREAGWHWEKEKWRPRDIVKQKQSGHISFDIALAENPNFELVKGGWTRDLCGICAWILCASPSGECPVGYTNGRQWVCAECYEKFLSGPDYFDDYPDIT